MRAVAVAVALAAATAVPAAGQAVLGRTVAESTEAPLAGVFVTLTDTAGNRVAGFLSRPDGRFLISAPAGRYALRAELIGYGTVDRLVELAADSTARLTLRLPLEALALEGIVARASGDRRCRLDPDEGDALSRLWSEARKGLEIADWAEEKGWLRADGYTYERILEPAELEVLAETAEPARSLQRQAFAAADPEVTRAEGFVVREDNAVVYRGADARTLLSDAFQATHCFRLLRSDTEGLVGMGFEPSVRRDVADIQGVLWLDGETARLHSLEYRYTRYLVNYPLPESRYGGFIRFRHLPGGGVAVERWWIRMPTLRHFADPAAIRSVERCGMQACDDPATLRELAYAGLAIKEAGGAVRTFRLADGTTLPAGDGAAIAGTVVDSTAAGPPAPLVGAEVWAQGTEHRAVTDARGRFRIDPLPEGAYRLAFHHPRLAEVGVDRPAARLVRARTGEVVRTTLALPSRPTLAALRCRARGDAAEAGSVGQGRIVYGVVRDAATGAGIAGARVRLLAVVDRDEAEAVAATETDAYGRYSFCDAPDAAERVVADFLGAGEQTVRLPGDADGPTEVAFELALSMAARLLGRVVTADGTQPVSGAEVVIRGTGRHVITDDAGRFAFDSVAPGALTLAASHIAYRPAEGAVSVRGGEVVRVELRVADRVLELDPLVVTARSRPLLMDERMAGFYVRRARGMGTFMDGDELARRAVSRVSDVLREAQGFEVVGTGMLRATRSGCTPLVYVDGALISTHEVDPGVVADAARINADSQRELVHIINSIPPDELAGLEIYPGPSTVPGEFARLDANCGAIVIWTRSRDRSQ